MKNTSLSVLIALLLASSTNAQTAQPSTPPVSILDLQREIARLKEALVACESSKAPVGSPQRSEAVASLRAVKSALGAGANLQEFKRYYIESRIKVDALPDTPENNVIREISDIYRDAVSFSIAKITGTISSTELEVARKRYAAGAHIIKFLADMKPNDASRGLAHDLNQVGAQATASVLLIRADERFKELR